MSEQFIGDIGVAKAEGGTDFIELDANSERIFVRDSSGAISIELDGDDARLRLGEAGRNDGDVYVHDYDGNETIHLGGDDARIRLGASGGNDGDVFLHDHDGNQSIHLGGNDARLRLGESGGDDADIFMHDRDGNEVIHIDGRTAQLLVGKSGGEDGDVVVHDAAGNETVHLGGDDARLRLGETGGNDGDIFIHDSDGNETIHLGGNDARLRLGATGNNDGDIFLHDADGNETIKLGGNAGDIFLKSGDCAEEFETNDPSIEPGSVVRLDDDGELQRTTEPYDTRVAGIVSGAGEYDPGVVLDRQGDRASRAPVALVGKVGCWADTSNGAISVGDLLTTADRPGTAMKATDPTKAFGAVIGKALSPLERDQGLITVLASLR